MSTLASARAEGPPIPLVPRVALGLLGAAQAEIGLWGLIAPHSFFTSYPGAGHHWVSALGPYNQHLVRDFAATELALAVLLFAAAIWFERRLVLVAGVTFLVATFPHFAYHLTTTGSLSTGDNIASLSGFVLELGAISLAMMAVSRRFDATSGASHPPRS
jgi:hypothetical protein